MQSFATKSGDSGPPVPLSSHIWRMALSEPANTISDRALAALDALRGWGWTVRPAGERRPLPDVIDRRYPAIPPSLRVFLEHLEQCERGDECVWFLTAADYAATTRSAFAWDEWEQLEKDGADPDSAAESRAFWNAHLPILQAVDGDYAYFAVCVDPASPNYGCVVEGYAPDFHETVIVNRSFDELLERIVRLQRGSSDDALAGFLLHPHDERRLRSDDSKERTGLFRPMLNRLRSLPLFESYRVAVVAERRFSRPLWSWENWSKIMPPLAAVMARLSAEAVIRPRQAGDHDNWLRFGRLPWNEQSNRTWTMKYLADPKLAGKVHFIATEIWAPSRAISFEKWRGPELFCLLDRNQADDTQGFVLAIRKDVLRRVDIAADETIFSVREFFLENSSCAVFDRRWGERGRFGSTMVINGLDWTQSHAVLQWAKDHPRSSALSFRWRGRRAR